MLRTAGAAFIKENGMPRKPHTFLLLTIVLASFAAGAGCDKLRARDKLNKGVQAYKAGQPDLAIEDFKQAKEFDPSLTNARPAAVRLGIAVRS